MSKFALIVVANNETRNAVATHLKKEGYTICTKPGSSCTGFSCLSKATRVIHDSGEHPELVICDAAINDGNKNISVATVAKRVENGKYKDIPDNAVVMTAGQLLSTQPSKVTSDTPFRMTA